MNREPHRTEQAPIEEDALMRRAAGGDSQAFGLLVRAYQTQIVRFATRMTLDAEAARDIAQETFLRVWRARHRYQAQGQFRLYLLRIARNACLDHLRAHTEWESLSEEAPLAEQQGGERGVARGSDVPATVCARLLNQDMQTAVATLPESQRVVFLLSHEEGLTYKEIALVLDCPPGTVASRKFQAMETLRRRLCRWNEAE